MTRCFRVVDLRVSIFIFHPTTLPLPSMSCVSLVFIIFYFTTSEERTLCVLEKPFFLDRHLATHACILEFFFDDYGTGLSLPWLIDPASVELFIMADGCLCNFQPHSVHFSHGRCFHQRQIERFVLLVRPP
jgi:hypothetical protein